VQRRIIPGVIDGQQALWCLPPGASACDAARLMRERRIGGVMVVERGALVGIVTERDMVTRLLAEGRDPRTTPLGEIMTADPETLRPDDTALAALEKMRAGRYRHLPVLDGDGRVCGMVSIRDLFEAVRRTLEEELHSAEALIYGDSYGVAAPPPSPH
jgi:signal-transduction protein with cAMP-binding, CBS, and nucleotidyltransferase domain